MVRFDLYETWTKGKTVMNKQINLFMTIMLMVALPGCISKYMGKKNNDTLRVHQADNQKGPRFLFIDDEQGEVEDFVFEDDAQSPLHDASEAHTPLLDDAGIEIVPEQHDELYYRRSQQAEHGFKTVYFGFDQFTVRDDQKSMLQHDLNVVKRLTGRGKTIVIEGHSCKSAGSPVYNMMLSEKRAQSVAKYFVEHGASVDKLKIVGRGQELCIVHRGNRKQQAPNRRVELYILDKK
jgi:outer membrane protein OmpA-like peptidoglycan-associated protein